MNKINKDWKEVKLGDIVDITMGQSPKSEFYNKRNEGMPFLQGSATFGFMHPYFETYSSDIKKIAINGSVLMSVRAPVGDLNIANADVCIGRGLCSINGKSNIINRYIFYLLSYYKPKLLKYLENTIKLIEEKERFKRGIAKKLLTCKEGENIPEARFKGFEDEWETKTLNSISNIKKGEQKNKLDLIADGKYPVLNGGMNFSGYCNSYNREANTITISEGGNAGYVNFIKENFWSSGHCYTLHDLKIDKYFLYQCLKNSEKRLMKLQLGTALKNIRQSEIVEFELNIPKSIKEQEKIGGYLNLKILNNIFRFYLIKNNL
ncbi:MAG: restriction endonuclease subunit S [Brachyspira sp.]|nr:restriction endonuclease subunit S [Brachyspira sp.]